VPTALGDIVVSASALIDGIVRSAISASVAAVLGGTTNVGDIVLGSGNRIVVANASSGTATIIDISQATPTVVATIPTGGSNPIGVSMTPDGSRALIANFNSGTVTFLDLTATPPVVIGTPLATGGSTESVAITASGQFAVTAGNGANISVRSIDIATRTILSTLVTTASAVTITPDGRTVILADFGLGRLQILSLSTAGVLTSTGVTVANAGGPLSMAMAPNGRWALVSNFNNGDVSVLRISAAGAVTVGARIPVCCSTTGVAITPDGTKAYVTGTFGVAVLRVDAQDNVTDSGVRVAVPNGVPNSYFGVPGIAVGPNGRAYISNQFTNTITVLNTQTDTIVGTIAVGSGPAGIGVPK
jgi:YVTN family beta-propeller protein